MELVLTSLTIDVDEVALPVLIVEVGEELSGFDPEELSGELATESSLPEGVASSIVASPVAMMELSPLLASD
jgi:hypothetical protein